MPARHDTPQPLPVAYPRKMCPRREKQAIPDLKPADRGVSELLLRACHDLRSPLRSIRANAELLLRDGTTGETSDFEKRLGFIADGAKRMELLADGLASYSLALEIERGTFQSIAMDVLLRGALARLEKELRDAGAKISYDSLPRVVGNADRLMQVLENLLRNAIRHGAKKSPVIQIGAEKRADEWCIAVCDNGPGVEAAYLESIFRPFERLNGSESPGAGLGLTICQAIVERHGGRIWAESNIGSGSTFLFTLPAE
jgi:two-component system, chemotaxis family, sensor kinase Cph1